MSYHAFFVNILNNALAQNEEKILCSFGNMIYSNKSNIKPFLVDIRKGHREQEPPVTIKPWKTVKVNREYGGDWFNIADVDGDGEVEIISCKARNTTTSTGGSYLTSCCVQKLDGSVLWTWGDPSAGQSSGVDKTFRAHDIDNDGNIEVLVGTKGKMHVLEGKTGKERYSFPLPEWFSNDRMVVADIQGKGYRSDIVLKDAYTQVYACTAEGKELWHWTAGAGHTTTPVDINGDGREEIAAGGDDGEAGFDHTDAVVCINHEGKAVWRVDPFSNKICNPFVTSLVRNFQQKDFFGAEQYLQRPYAGGSFRYDEDTLHFFTRTGHPDHFEVVHMDPDPSKVRVAFTLCAGNGVIYADGLGNLLWKRMLGYHCEMVRSAKLRDDLGGKQLVVDYDHMMPFCPEKPLAVFHENGDLLGHYMSNYARNHQPVDWDNNGTQRIAFGNDHLLLDGSGNIIADLEIPDDRLPWIVGVGDCTGSGSKDIVLSVYTKIDTSKHSQQIVRDREQREQWIYIYTNPELPSEKKVIPEGLPANFTFY